MVGPLNFFFGFPIPFPSFYIPVTLLGSIHPKAWNPFEKVISPKSFNFHQLIVDIQITIMLLPEFYNNVGTRDKRAVEQQ